MRVIFNCECGRRGNVTPFQKSEVTPSAWKVRAVRGVVSDVYQSAHMQVGLSCPIISPLRNITELWPHLPPELVKVIGSHVLLFNGG